MIGIEKDSDNGILTLKASDKLTKEDLKALTDPTREFVDNVDDPHLLMLLDNFRGWKDAAAFWKDLQLDSEMIGYFDRIAVVGDRKWEDWGTRLMNPITKSELKFFDLADKEKARKWLESH